jgi:predicted transcriptional regulator
MTKLNIHVGGTFADDKRRILDAVARAETNPETFEAEDHVSFASWEALARVMTTKRFELLRHLHRQPEATVAALARSLKRDYKRVHEDVETLSGVGLIDRRDDGLHADYDEIRTMIAL